MQIDNPVLLRYSVLVSGSNAGRQIYKAVIDNLSMILTQMRWFNASNAHQ